MAYDLSFNPQEIVRLVVYSVDLPDRLPVQTGRGEDPDLMLSIIYGPL